MLKNSFKGILFTLVAVSFLALAWTAWAQEAQFAQQGLQAYQKGDMDGAILSFENALARHEDEDKIKPVLVAALLDKSRSLFIQGDYTKALGYSSRAKELAPDNQEAAQLHNLLLQAQRTVELSSIQFYKKNLPNTSRTDSSTTKTKSKIIVTMGPEGEKLLTEILESNKQTQAKVEMLQKTLNPDQKLTIPSFFTWSAAILGVILVLILLAQGSRQKLVETMLLDRIRKRVVDTNPDDTSHDVDRKKR